MCDFEYTTHRSFSALIFFLVKWSCNRHVLVEVWEEIPGTKHACDSELIGWIGGESLEAEIPYISYFNNVGVILDCYCIRREK